MSEPASARASVRIFADQEVLSVAAARLFVEVARTAVAERGLFSVVLSGGSTPRALYRLLAQPPYEAAVPWASTHVFWSDERLVPPDNEGSNYGQASADLLSHVAIPEDNVHRARGELAAGVAVEAYAAQLRDFVAHHTRGAVFRWPRFDLVLLGLGSDGHTASLFPGAATGDWESIPVVGATAEYQGRPAERLTLTPLAINDARHVLFLVNGSEKAEAVAAVLQGEIDPERWPAQRIRPRAEDVTWMLDKDAAAGLAGF